MRFYIPICSQTGCFNPLFLHLKCSQTEILAFSFSKMFSTHLFPNLACSMCITYMNKLISLSSAITAAERDFYFVINDYITAIRAVYLRKHLPVSRTFPVCVIFHRNPYMDSHERLRLLGAGSQFF